MTTPKPPEFDAWRPWYHMYDHERQRTVRVYKEAHELPIVIELSRDGNFRQRAHDWAWTRQGPTPKAMTPTTWPPKYATAIEWIGLYYYEIYRGFHGNAPHLIEEVTTMEQAKAQALALSAANPFLVF